MSHLNKSGIYQIQNTSNGNLYIGSAINLRKRWNLHLTELRRDKHHNQHLQHAWNRYGENIFEFKPIIICSPCNLITYEQICLDSIKPTYNICRKAGSQLGVKRSLEWKEKQKLRKRRSGYKISTEHYEKLVTANIGIIRSPKICAKISKGKIGHSVSLETRMKISNTLKERYKK